MTTAPTTGKPLRVTKRRAETRAKLMDAAFRVFAQKGYGRVTIEDVCEAAGYTRGAFYSQFESLEELFFLLYDEWAACTAEKVRAAMEGMDPTVDLSGAIERIVDTLLFERDWLLIKFDFLLYCARKPELAHRWEVHRAELRKVIEDGLSVSDIEMHESIGSVADTARAIVVAYDGVTVQLLLDSDEIAARSWITQLINVVLAKQL